MDSSENNLKVFEEWNYQKNDTMPESITPSSNKKVWWICKACGYEWRATVYNRTHNHSGCPRCARHIVWEGHNDLATVNPALCKQWDFLKNTCLPSEVLAGSNKKVWWICNICGYQWQATIYHRNNGEKCPVCSGKAVWEGHNDLATTDPRLLNEWDYEKNTIIPTEISRGSGKQVWWKCTKCGGSWKETPYKRAVSHFNCPYCSGNRVLLGYNDLETKNPELCREWVIEKNNPLTPQMVTVGSHKKVWWKCHKCGYEWIASIKDRQTRNCPVCAGKAVWEGHNDIATTDPHLLKEWDFEKNTIIPTEISRGSGKQVWWKCNKCGGSWKETIDKRAVSGYNCPFCSGRRVLVGFNDLFTKFPELYTEWDYEKNSISPYTVTAKSMKKVWWKCLLCGHSYNSTIADKTDGHGCPRCAKENRTSFPEQAIFFYVKKLYPDTKSGYKPSFLKGKELDVFIPSISTAIEYDGYFWHQDVQKDAEKDELVNRNGISLIRIREPECPKYNSTSKIFTTDTYSKDGTHINIVLHQVLEYLLTKKGTKSIQPVDIDFERDRMSILGLFALKRKDASLAMKYPEIALEWNQEKNGNITPDKVSCGSNVPVWWKCKKCGHEWVSSVKYRVSVICGCPVCLKKKVVPGINDLNTLKPEIAREWNQELNGLLKASDVSIYDTRSVWWTCSNCGKEWKESIRDRKGPRCSSCNYSLAAKQRHLKPGINDLQTMHPELLTEWDYSKNLGIDPATETYRSHKKVWWICKTCGYSWQAQIGDRSANHGCPECGKLKKATWKKTPIEGQSFADLYPQIAEEWDYSKNGNLYPENFKAGSQTKVWWKCKKCGREWMTSICNRTAGHGCRKCAHTKND